MKAIIYSAIALFTVAGMSCKTCKDCEVQTITWSTVDTGFVIDTTTTTEEFCNTILENVEKESVKTDTAADGTITWRTWTCN